MPATTDIREQVKSHRTRQSCWVIIKDKVYDLTNFVDSHPGGADIILRYAGKDATKAYEPIHPKDALEKYLQPDQHLGDVDTTSLPKPPTLEVMKAAAPIARKARLTSMISLEDFEKAAASQMAPRAFAYYKSGADDELAIEWNRKAWRKIHFRPRVLVPVESVDLRTTILGRPYALPFFICPTGGGKLAHPLGEAVLTKAAERHNIMHWLSNVGGCTKYEVAEARRETKEIFWQIYAAWDLEKSAEEVREAERLGYKGFALTVDCVRTSKRERDVRATIVEQEAEDELMGNTVPDDEEESDAFTSGPAVTRAPSWPLFSWISAVKWLRDLTSLPILVKGIQCWEDALLCMQYGAQPWLSNHGGRQLEGAPSAAETLLDIRRHCPEVLTKCDVIVDGGVRRGTDVVKALALGAKGVGLGRPFLFALPYGEAGVSKAIQILQHEVETTMALIGVTSIDQLRPEYLNTRRLELLLSHL